jgi:hypothetical protein
MTPDGRWLVCKPCHVSFVFDRDHNLYIQFEKTHNNWCLTLNLYPNENKTVLTAFRAADPNQSPDVEDEYIRTEIAQCMTDVTPANCLDKMKLIMVFQ